MRDTVYFLAFDGFADWHAAHALCEIRRPGDWQLKTVGFSMQPVLSMGGLRVVPELTLDQLDLQRAALLIAPIEEFFQTLGDRVPEELWAELSALKKRLGPTGG